MYKYKTKKICKNIKHKKYSNKLVKRCKTKKINSPNKTIKSKRINKFKKTKNTKRKKKSVNNTKHKRKTLKNTLKLTGGGGDGDIKGKYEEEKLKERQKPNSIILDTSDKVFNEFKKAYPEFSNIILYEELGVKNKLFNTANELTNEDNTFILFCRNYNNNQLLIKKVQELNEEYKNFCCLYLLVNFKNNLKKLYLIVINTR